MSSPARDRGGIGAVCAVWSELGDGPAVGAGPLVRPLCLFCGVAFVVDGWAAKVVGRGRVHVVCRCCGQGFERSEVRIVSE